MLTFSYITVLIRRQTETFIISHSGTGRAANHANLDYKIVHHSSRY